MKRYSLILLFISFTLIGRSAVIKWDGGGGNGLWATALNWSGNVVPVPGDDVVLDNSLLAGNFTVTLPNGAVSTSIKSLLINPSGANTIKLILPSTNTAVPGLDITGTGDVLVLNNGGSLQNSSGSAAGLAVTVSNAAGVFRINNGGKYIHNTTGQHALLFDKLSIVAGTETGIIAFDVPAGGGYTLSIAGRTLGTLILSATTAGSRSYLGVAGTDLAVRGNFVVNSGVTFSCTSNANILVAGDFSNSGTIPWNPSVANIANRRFIFNGTASQNFTNTGTLPGATETNFNGYTVQPGSTVILQTDFPVNKGLLQVDGTLDCGIRNVLGTGSFTLNATGLLIMGSPGGITSAPTASGNVQTNARTFLGAASYEYAGTVPQITGNGLPTTITGTLRISNSSPLFSLGVTLTNSTTIQGFLDLDLGKLRTSSSSLITITSAGNFASYGPDAFIGGPLQVIGHPAFTFPIGINAASAPTGTIYAPLVMNSFDATSNPTDSYTAEYIRANPQSTIGSAIQSPINHISFVEYWKFFRTDGGTNKPVKQIVLEVNQESVCYDLSTLLVARYNGTQWTNNGNSPNTIQLGSSPPLVWGKLFSLDTITSVSGYYTLSTTEPFADNPLPVTLISFDAHKLSTTKSSVDWELGSVCSPAANFEVQRTGTASGFVTIGTLPGSTTGKSYNFIDNDLKNGINYYRLKITGEDGKINYSRTVAVMNGISTVLLTSMIPTVVNHSASLTVSSSAREKITIIVTDMQGRIVQQNSYNIDNGNSTIEIGFDRLATGIYQLTGTTSSGRLSTIRFMKQ
jgi:hypothetical protein